jgi:hypothetical protein
MDRRIAHEKRSRPRSNAAERPRCDAGRRAPSSQSFAVRLAREADVPLVVHGLTRRGTEQHNLLVELRCTRKRDTTEVQQGRCEASRDLRRAGAGCQNLVESDMNACRKSSASVGRVRPHYMSMVPRARAARGTICLSFGVRSLRSGCHRPGLRELSRGSKR